MSQAFKPMPTARELIAARQAQAPTPAPKELRPVAVARAEYNSTYRSRYLDEVAPASIAGRLIKFSKDGDFTTTDDNKPLPEDAEYVLLAEETQIGWLKFNGAGEAPERHMGLLFDGYEMPTRESLGDLDPSEWELGLDNQPADPWSAPDQYRAAAHGHEGAVHILDVEQDGSTCGRQLAAPLRAHAEDSTGRAPRRAPRQGRVHA